MKLRASTLERIAIEYAEAVASGRFERAEGWFAVARFAAEREADRARTIRHPAVMGQRSRSRAS